MDDTLRGEGVRATAAELPRRAHPGAGADRSAHAHHRAVRDRRGERAAAGGAADERDGRRAGGVQERLHRGQPPRRRHRRCHLGDGGDLHPPRRRCADRHVEHGRHHPHRRLLRHRPASAGDLLRRRRPHLRRRRGGHRQLVDHRRHARRGVRRHGPDPRHVHDDRRRSHHLRRLHGRQDVTAVGDHGAGAEPGRRGDRQPAHPGHAVDGRTLVRHRLPHLSRHRHPRRSRCRRPSASTKPATSWRRRSTSPRSTCCPWRC